MPEPESVMAEIDRIACGIAFRARRREVMLDVMTTEIEAHLLTVGAIYDWHARELAERLMDVLDEERFHG